MKVRPDVFIMTNEEKAREISDNILGSLEYQCGAEEGARAMAKWKDQCFNDIIKRLRETYERDDQVLFILQLVESRYNEKF